LCWERQNYKLLKLGNRRDGKVNTCSGGVGPKKGGGGGELDITGELHEVPRRRSAHRYSIFKIGRKGLLKGGTRDRKGDHLRVVLYIDLDRILMKLKQRRCQGISEKGGTVGKKGGEDARSFCAEGNHPPKLVFQIDEEKRKGKSGRPEGKRRRHMKRGEIPLGPQSYPRGGGKRREVEPKRKYKGGGGIQPKIQKEGSCSYHGGHSRQKRGKCWQGGKRLCKGRGENGRQLMKAKGHKGKKKLKQEEFRRRRIQGKSLIHSDRDEGYSLDKTAQKREGQEGIKGWAAPDPQSALSSGV